MESNESNITTSIETIDPTTARQWLESYNKRNRPLSKATIATYASDMSKGLWRVNGTTIVFDTAGTLVDGQHRLEAICQAQVTVEALVVRGVQEGSFATVDIGRTRTLKNAFQADLGIPKANRSIDVAQAASKMILSYLRRESLVHKGKVPHLEVLDYYHENRSQIDADVKEVLELPKHLPAHVFASLLYLSRDPTNEDWGDYMFKRFIEDVSDPTNLTHENPAKTLRTYLDEFPAGQRRDYVPFKIAAAWNAYCSGVPVGNLHKETSVFIKVLKCRTPDTEEDTWSRPAPTSTPSDEPTEPVADQATEVTPAKVRRARVGSSRKSKDTSQSTESTEPPKETAAFEGFPAAHEMMV
jgi:hypothetical protein